MGSPLVSRLLEAINGSQASEARAVLLAELAGYWARIGNFGEAEKIRADLRASYGDGRSLHVSILIMYVEALLLYYKDLSPAARERMVRAFLLSKASGHGKLIALTSAWMAHIDFNLNRFDDMVVELKSYFEFSSADDGNAECRAAIVVGDAFLYAGDVQSSRHWYEIARRAAIKLGDQAAVGAMTYNRASLRVASLRFQSIAKPIAAEEISMAVAEINSAINYQNIARLRSLDHLLYSAEVGMQIIRGNFELAASQASRLLSSGEVSAGSPQEMLLNADLILSLSKLGKFSNPENAFGGGAFSSLTGAAPDDRAMIYSSLVKAAIECGQHEFSERLSALQLIAVEEHKAVVDALARSMSSFARVEGRSH